MGQDSVAVIAHHPQRRHGEDRKRLQARIGQRMTGDAIDQHGAGEQQAIAQEGEGELAPPRHFLDGIEEPVEHGGLRGT